MTEIPQILKCNECNNSFTRTPSQIRSDNIFCSSSCSAKFHNRPRKIIKKCPTCHQDYHPSRGGKGIYCSKKCQQKFQTNLVYQKIERGEYTFNGSGNKVLRNYLVSRRGYKCEKCLRTEWNNQQIPLTTHHKDGNASNNIPSNLELLCWNCHALTENYGKKNKISARTTRYKLGASSENRTRVISLPN